MNEMGTLSELRSPRRPRILLLDTNRWPATARLAVSLCSLGSAVSAVCPLPGHPVRSVRHVDRIFPYRPLHPLQSIRYAIEQVHPDFVLPSCDRSVQHLHALHALCLTADPADRRIAALIEHSLGLPESFPVVSSRYDLLMAAAAEGIQIPCTLRIDSVEDLRRWDIRLPWMLKVAGTWGGRGVREVNSLPEAEKTLVDLTTRASVLQMLRQMLLNRDREAILAKRQYGSSEVIAQARIEGRPANCGVACWKGELLAGIAVEVLQAEGPRQPATLVEVVEGREMMHAAQRIAARLRLSGIFGLDFVIEEGTGAFYLIEMNPRCTPCCPLPLGEEHDLVTSIWSKISGVPRAARAPMTRSSRIAYFPQACAGTGCYFENAPNTAYLDVPHGEPELIHEFLQPWSERSVAGQLLDRLRKRAATRNSSRTAAPDSTPAVRPSLSVPSVDAQPAELRAARAPAEHQTVC